MWVMSGAHEDLACVLAGICNVNKAWVSIFKWDSTVTFFEFFG